MNRALLCSLFPIPCSLTAMPTLGVTGGLASGKSAACRLLKKYGATVFSADEAARAVLSVGNGLLEAIACEFGADVLLADGTLDRATLGKLIFTDPAARQRLDSLTHPPILRLLHAQMETARYESCAGMVIAVEVPLLFETNLSDWFDRIAVVDASETLQVERLRLRNNLNEAEARRRLAAQWPLSRKCELADYILSNDGPAQELETAVQNLLMRLREEFSVPPEKK